MPKILDLAGKTFGRLSVIERVYVPKAHNVMWRCKCECGNETIAAAANIGKTTFSCGCLAREAARNLLTGNTYQRTHNSSQTTEYRIWSKMRDRCLNPNNPKYHRYGGRGITICKRWLDDFESFRSDMGMRPPGLSVDRIDNDGNYEPSNCHWGTSGEQSRNKSTNNVVTIDSKSMCIADWCHALDVPRWKPYEMCRATGSKRNGPPQFDSPEAAIRELYRRHHAKP